MIDKNYCSNSSYWQDYRLLSLFLIGIGILAFLIISLLLIRYLYVHDKGKRKKKAIIIYFVSIFLSLAVFASGIILSKHIDNKTKNLTYCLMDY